MEKVKVGLIGAGLIGKVHANNLLTIRNAHLEMVSDLFINKMNDWVESIGVQNVTDDYTDVLSNPDIDVVMICSPPETHEEIIAAAAKAGKHIFCEKPISLNLEETQRSIDVIEESGVKFTVGFMRRFDHNFKRVFDMIQDGNIGDPHIIKITSRDPQPPPVYTEVAGAIFLETTIHDYDMARYLAGSEVKEVYAYGSSLIDSKYEEFCDVDTAITTLKFESNALCVIDNSRKSEYGYDQRVEVFGSKGGITVENDYDNSAVLSTAKGLYKDKPKNFFKERYVETFKKEVEAFFDCILNNKEVLATGFDGLQSELIAHAARLSLKEKRPVKLEELSSQIISN